MPLIAEKEIIEKSSFDDVRVNNLWSHREFAKFIHPKNVPFVKVDADDDDFWTELSSKFVSAAVSIQKEKKNCKQNK